FTCALYILNLHSFPTRRSSDLELADESDQNGLIIMANDTDISAFGPGSRFGLVHDVFGVTPVDEGIESSTHGKNESFEYVAEQEDRKSTRLNSSHVSISYAVFS